MKTRKVLGLAAAAVVAFTLSACSGGSTPAETAPAAPVKESAPAQETSAQETSAQTVHEACLAMVDPLAKVSTAIAESAQASVADPQTAVNAWTDLANGFETIAADAQNAEVKAAATTAHADIASVRDAMQKVFVDQDMSTMGDYTAATENMRKSYTALLELCQ